MLYTVGEMAKRLGVPPSTLRYYDKEGLLPFVERSSSGIRMFKDSDFEWLQVIGCLKKAGMSLAEIRCFIEMAMRGDSTIDERLSLIVRRKQAVMRQIEELHETLETLEFKQWFYETAKSAGTTEYPRNMALEELPEKFRETRKRLRGE
ncbi:MAG: MerR family transcriptional regulator [Candidatus Avispirillum sp.]